MLKTEFIHKVCAYLLDRAYEFRITPTSAKAFFAYRNGETHVTACVITVELINTHWKYELTAINSDHQTPNLTEFLAELQRANEFSVFLIQQGATPKPAVAHRR